MCGLAGAICRTFSKEEPYIFNQMMRTLNLRGLDGTGIVRVDQQGVWNSSDYEYTTWKKTLNSLDAMKELKENTLFEPSFVDQNKVRHNLRCLMGHVRHATSGSLKVKHTHPFKIDNFLIMHNGTIESYNLNKNQLDSYHLARQIADKGIKGALVELDDQKDAYAISYIDTKENTINFIRNSKRPLFFAKIQGSMMIWSSEKGHLEWICDRLGKTIHSLQALPTHHLFSIDMHNLHVDISDFSDDLKKNL